MMGASGCKTIFGCFRCLWLALPVCLLQEAVAPPKGAGKAGKGPSGKGKGKAKQAAKKK